MEGAASYGKKVETSGASADSQDIVRKFLKLKQTTTVQDFQAKFEEMRELLLTVKFGLPEGFLISTFLNGLKPEFKRSLGDLKLETLEHAFNMARVKEVEFEMTIEDNMRRLELADPTLPREYMQVNVGADNPTKCEAFLGGRAISVLMASGIECSFIDTSLVKHVGSKLVDAKPLRVVFGFIGHEAPSRFRFPKLQWTAQDHEFTADVRVVEIKAYDLILGTDWLRSIGRMTLGKDGVVIPKDGNDVLLKYCKPW